jgi:hypothetical protein
VRDWWIKELLSLLCSLGSLIAIVVVLAEHDKKPSHNLAAGVSLNTYLAVFATIAKAGLMYPVMSCIGQLKWIWFSKENALWLILRNSMMRLVGLGTHSCCLGDSSFGMFIYIRYIFFLVWSRTDLLTRHTASIGTVITILAIGISPITQQAIAYPNQLVPSLSASSAQVPSANL